MRSKIFNISALLMATSITFTSHALEKEKVWLSCEYEDHSILEFYMPDRFGAMYALFEGKKMQARLITETEWTGNDSLLERIVIDDTPSYFQVTEAHEYHGEDRLIRKRAVGDKFEMMHESEKTYYLNCEVITYR